MYLSYPALYTHIKNKHGGESPEGTTKQPIKRTKPNKRNDGDYRQDYDRENSNLSGEPSSYGDRGSDSEDNSQTDDRDSNLSASNLNDNSVFKSAKTKKKIIHNKLSLLSERLYIPRTLKALFRDTIPHQLKSFVHRQQLEELEQTSRITNFNLEGKFAKDNKKV